MPSIKIVHFSDVLASRAKDGKSRLSALREFIRQQVVRNRWDHVDYIVAAGNLTADGDPASFAMAREFLEELAKLLLERSGPSHHHRLLIVPGPRDLSAAGPARGASAAFRDFHDGIHEYGIEHGFLARFDPRKAMRRHLKDLTFVGLSFWPADAHLGPRPGLQSQIQSLSQDSVEYEYVRRTPTLLVSYGVPSLVSLSTGKKESVQLGSTIEALSTTLYLFGAADTVLIVPQPRGLKRLCLGTGPRVAGSPWPFNLNMIELKVLRDDGPSAHLEATITTRTKIALSGPPPSETYSFSVPSSCLPMPDVPPPPNPDAIVPPFLKRLQEVLESDPDNTQFIWLLGLPGSGRFQIFKGSRGTIPLGGRTYHYYQAVITNRQFEGDLDHLVSEALKAGKRETKDIVVIRDDALNHLESQERAEHIQKISEKLSPLIGQRVALVYMKNPLWLPNEGPFQSRSFQTEKIRCTPLTPENMVWLERHYGSYYPVDPRQVGKVTGRYAGLSRQVFVSTKEIFTSWDGARPINQMAGGLLLAECLFPQAQRTNAQNDFFLMAEDLFGVLRRPSRGDSVVNFIVEQARALAERDKFARELGDLGISFTEQQLAAATGDKVEVVRPYLKSLVDTHILAQAAEGEPYHVNVLAPFLVARTKPDYHVFFSYSTENGQSPENAEYVRKLAEELDRLAAGQFSHFDYRTTLPHGDRVTDNITDALKKHRNLIVVQGKQKELTPYSKDELSRWFTHWKQESSLSPSSLIWVADDGIVPHLHLNDTPRISPEPVEKAARAILGILRAEGEPFLD